MSTTVKLTVTGMKCGGCDKTVTDKLMAKDGVSAVTADHANDLVEVVFDEAVIEEDDLLDCIEEAGFTVVD